MLRLPFFETFDAPTTLASCARRESSTHAPQGVLELLNGPLSNDLAAAFAARLAKRSPRAEPGRLQRLGPSAWRSAGAANGFRGGAILGSNILRDETLEEFSLALSNLNGFLGVPLTLSLPTPARPGLAESSSATPSAASAARAVRVDASTRSRPGERVRATRSPPSCPIWSRRRSRSSSCSWPAARSHLGDLRPQALAAQQAPTASPGPQESRRWPNTSSFQGNARLLGTKRTFRK